MGSSGSSGGGSSSGTVDYPEYMKDFHGDLLNLAWEIIQADYGVDSPYAFFSTADPNTVFGVAGAWTTPASHLNDFHNYSIPSNICNNTALSCLAIPSIGSLPDRISELTSDMSSALGARLNAEVLPRLKTGLLNIGAVCSSAYSIAQSNLENENTRQIARADAELRLKRQDWYLDSWVKHSMQQRELGYKVTAAESERLKLVGQLALEIGRIYSASKYDNDVIEAEMAAKDRRWDMENLQYGANVLAGISGGTVTRGSEVKQSSIGGAISSMASGAAAGAMAGSAIPGVGTAVGAGVGAALGLISSLF